MFLYDEIRSFMEFDFEVIKMVHKNGISHPIWSTPNIEFTVRDSLRMYEQFKN